MSITSYSNDSLIELLNNDPNKMDIDDVKRKTLTKQEKKLKTLSSKRNLPIPDIVYEAILEERSRYVVPDIEKEDVTDIVVDTSDFLKDIKAS